MDTIHTTSIGKKVQVLREPVAIVGMACRFPQAASCEAFWELLKGGKDAIREVPDARWNAATWYDPDPLAPNKTHQRHAAMLDRIDDFDPLFFGISPAEAAEMNPSQKLMLELVWEAMENTQMPVGDTVGKKAGIYVGNIWSDFEHHRKHKHAAVTSHSAMGQASNIIANRVSFTYGFTGPSLVVDTGCSSSLVALHLACQSLWDDSTELAFAAGVNHILDPDQYVLLSKFGGLSAKGKCSTFDAGADGFVRGEGGGVLVLKKLAQAEADGNKILAVIRGSAMNNNGYNVNLPATSVEGQKQMLADAYRHSGIDPAQIHYVEAHGTGTRLGDPTEARALGEFFREGRNAPLHIGSVKTNIGHLEGAAGMAGLIKVVLAMHHHQLPPSLNFNTPNPEIPFDELKLQVQHQLGAWPAAAHETLKAGINSFGWGGTNAHTVIEEYRCPVDGVRPNANIEQGTPNIEYRSECRKAERQNEIQRERQLLLPLSAQSEGALKEYVAAYRSLIADTPTNEVEAICAATARVKPVFDYRVLFIAAEKDSLLAELDRYLQEAPAATRATLTDKDKLVMVFPGQGSQWVGMGRELFQHEPVFRQTIEACHEAFKPYTDWSLIGQLHAGASPAVPIAIGTAKEGADTSLLHEIHIVQPMLFAVQVALARLWMAWGIVPHTVVGHSMGEISAAHIAGVLDLHQAARIICTRSKLMKRVSGRGGAMAVTELSRTQAENWITRYPQLSLAVSNSPKSSVLAGDQQTLNIVLAELETQNLFARLVKVDVASHSPQMDSLKEDLFHALDGMKPHAAAIPIFSTVTGKPTSGESMDARYWVKNLRGTVLFNTATDKLLGSGHTVFVEVSPHPALVNAVQECAEHRRHTRCMTVPSLFREKPEQESIRKNLAELYTRGYSIDWARFYPGSIPRVDLPGYPFQRESHALENRSAEITVSRQHTHFPIIGQEFALADAGPAHFWEASVSLDTFPFLNDHRVNDTPIVPGAFYVEMILEACHSLYDKGVPVISHLRFIRAVTLAPKEIATLQLKLRRENKITTARLFQKVTTAGDTSWELLAEADLAMNTWPEYNQLTLEALHGPVMTGKTYCEKLQTLGLQYGSYFNSLDTITFCADGSIVSFTLSPSERLRRSPQAYQIHPAVLDAFLQPVFARAVAQNLGRNTCTTFLTDIGEIQYLRPADLSGNLHGIALLEPLRTDEQRGFTVVEGDLMLHNADGATILIAKDVKARVIDTSLMEQRREKLRSWLYQVSWIKLTKEASGNPSALKTSVDRTTQSATWLILGDPYGVSGLLIEKLRRQGISCIHVTPGSRFQATGKDTYTIRYGLAEDYHDLFDSVFHDPARTITGILHAGSLSYTWQDPFLTADVVESLQCYGSISFMYMHQHLAALSLAQLPRLVIVTNGIHTTGEQDEVAQPVHSPLWGMVRVMFNELTQYTCRYVDLSANPGQEELDQLAGAVTGWTLQEPEVAMRGLQTYVPRLGPCADDTPPASKASFSADGTYLITGFRGLGFRFVEWMIRQGARGFALISRSGELSEELHEKIDALRERGCRFSIFRADAGNYSEIKQVWDDIENTLPPIKGIVHAAGVIEARTLTDLSADEFLRILNPKVKGAWNLHLLSLKKKLDCFILFSSASTLIGLSGQGSYVAANAFLDALAHCRKRMGLPGMSINWGVIRDVGMVANQSTLEKFARAEGFEPVTMPEALDVFQSIYDTLPTQIGIVKWNISSMAAFYSTLAQTGYFEGLLKGREKKETAGGNFLARLATLTSAAEKRDAITSLITGHVAAIVRIKPEHIGTSLTFKALGIDSLMAVQLRNRLEKDLGMKLPVGMFWSRPQIGEYAEYVCSSLETHTHDMPVETNSHAVTQTPALIQRSFNPKATTRLFCFHDAGGSASLYQGWEGYLGETVELVTIELPGRGAYPGDRTYSQIAPLLEDLKTQITPLLDKPYAFFGHSMGGMLAFELTHALQDIGQPMPAALCLSSTPGLDTYTADQVNPLLSDEVLTNTFPHLKAARGDDKVHTMLLHVLRTDLTLIGNYNYMRKDPLHVPFLVLHGQDDPRVTTAQAHAWRRETAAACTIVPRPGGHRYITGDVPFVTARVRDLLGVITSQPEYESIHT